MIPVPVTAADRGDWRDLPTAAWRIRRTVLLMCRGRGQGYAGQGCALADLMAHLYGRAMRRTDAGTEYRDRLVLSTGHSAIALYAALHEVGLYSLAELVTYGQDGSRIEESPLAGTPGFEITGGALGQGLSQAVGMALAHRMRGEDTTVYAIVSDGELQEGQTWEAAMFAGERRLGNLVLLVDNNHLQADGITDEVLGVEPVTDKFTAFGWDATRIDPHDHDVLTRCLPVGGQLADRPLVLVCETVPGAGVPILAEYRSVHYIRAADDLWAEALAFLDDHPPPRT